MNSKKHTAIIAMGSNIAPADDDMKAMFMQVIARFNVTCAARNYVSPAFPAGSGSDFLNTAFAIETDLKPKALLTKLHEIEAEFDRQRPYRWSPRTLDLDLIFCDDVIAPDQNTWNEWANLSLDVASKLTPDQLILPHPRAHERHFVLAPLLDILPQFIHPVLGKTMAQLWSELSPELRAGISLANP